MSKHFDTLYADGLRMGFAKGGKVCKVTDTGIMPANKGTSQQEIEAGGTPRLKPGYKEGGKVMTRSEYYDKNGSMKGYTEYYKSQGGKTPGDKIRAAEEAKKPKKEGRGALDRLTNKSGDELDKLGEGKKRGGRAFNNKPLVGRGSK